MKSWMLAAGAALAVVTSAGGAVAKPIPDGGVTVEELQAWLVDHGYKAQVEKGKDGGQAHIRSGADGLTFSVFFYDCKQNRCMSMEYYVGFDKNADTPNLETINAWNRDKRYMKTYLDKEGDVAFEFDVNLAPGGTWEAVEDDFSTFLNCLPAVKTLVKW